MRLVDAEQLDMGEAARNMAVYKPTLYRIVSLARHRGATALWQGRALRCIERLIGEGLLHFGAMTAVTVGL